MSLTLASFFISNLKLIPWEARSLLAGLEGLNIRVYKEKQLLIQCYYNMITYP